MGGKKIWAYAKDGKGEFIKESDKLKLFFIWSVIRLKKEQVDFFNSITFWSTQKDENKRKKMAPVKTGFFRYIENIGGLGSSSNGETLSHAIAIAALNQMKEIPFVIGNKTYIFKFNELQDEFNIKFENGNEYIIDLFGTFYEPIEFVEKWGGKLAIEVKVTHSCGNVKIRDFEDHNIPIIEITLNEKMHFLKEQRDEPFDENDIENYFHFITSRFKNVVYGKILSDPVLRKYHEKKITNYKNIISTIEFENTSIKEENIKLKSQEIACINDLKSTKSIIRNLTANNDFLKEENLRLRNRKNLIKRLLGKLRNISNIGCYFII